MRRSEFAKSSLGRSRLFAVRRGRAGPELAVGTGFRQIVGRKLFSDMEDVPVEAEYGVLEFNNHFFRNDSVKIHNSQVRQAVLLDEEDQPAVTVSFRTPVIAFWSPFDKHAPFVCIEPWYGIGDPRGYDGEFRDKPLMNHLMPGASFMSEYTIAIK